LESDELNFFNTNALKQSLAEIDLNQFHVLSVRFQCE